jgi:hypothetical protein
MEYEKLQAIIFSALERARTQEGDTIYDRFHVLEVADIVNILLQSLPLYPDFIIQDIQKRVLDVIPKEKQTQVNIHEVKELFKLFLYGESNKEQLALLIFLLMIQFTNTYKTGITEQLEEVKDYYYSLPIITTDKLQLEVKTNLSNGTTYNHNNYFIRVEDYWRFVPTIDTHTNFNNYIYKLKTN